MVLSDHSIRHQIAQGRIVVDPIDLDDVQPASIDLHLDSRFLVFSNSRQPYIDVRHALDDLTEPVEIDAETPFMLHPGEFVLGSTLEHIELPDDLVARLEGKSSLGRIGLLIHSTAGFVDPGWSGRLDAGVEQRGPASDRALLRHEDRPDFVSAAQHAGGSFVRFAGAGEQVPGPDRAYGQPISSRFQR